jgi:hypothetical protein
MVEFRCQRCKLRLMITFSKCSFTSHSILLKFRFAESHELFPGTVIGHSYKTGEFSISGRSISWHCVDLNFQVTINTPQYLAWLLKLFTEAGGKLKKDALSHVHDALRYCPDAQAIVNCTGLQARYLGGVMDQKLFPTRGQVVVINAPHIKKTLTQMSM